MHMPPRTPAPAGADNPVSAAASVVVVTVGLLVLVGWAFDIYTLKSLSGTITMKANAAIALLAAGVALRLRLETRRLRRSAGIACAALASLIGALTLSQHIAGWDLGIDELLFQEEPGQPATTSPGRMGPNSSFSLTLAGIAQLWFYWPTPRRLVRAQLIGATMALLALVPVIGYLYGATQLYAIARYTGIAFHTGVALLILSLGILAARWDVGPVSAVMSDAAHGVMARRLLVPAVLIPLVLGYVRIVGERRGWYDTGFGVSVFVVAVIALLSITIWRTAVALASSNLARQQAQQDRDDLLVSERAARERAEQADRAKDEFIAALSHELRTPLNAIVGWMQLVQSGMLPESKRAGAMAAVARNAAVLSRLIEDLLDTSRIATGRIELARAPVDLKAVVHAAVESVVLAAETKGVTVTAAVPSDMPTLIGDGHRLQQALWNLLANGIKFTAPGGHVRVETLTGEDAVEISVRDEGEGIDPQQLPHLFDRFWRRDTTSTRGHGGLGLGLYIARNLVEGHGGTIRAQSDGPGKGAVFTITLPTRRGSEGVGADPGSGSAHLSYTSR
jgi:signal transduction histidine kinase